MSSEQKPEIFGAGQVLFKQGDKSRDLYFVKEGEIELSVKNEDSQSEAVVATIGSRSVLGSMSFLEGEPRSATATVKTEATMVRINDGQREKLLKTIPSWLQVLIKDLSSNLRRINANYAKLQDEHKLLQRRYDVLKAKVKPEDEAKEDPDKVLD